MWAEAREKRLLAEELREEGNMGMTYSGAARPALRVP